jgi:uncharacterized protein YdbL (DUF1318 family)
VTYTGYENYRQDELIVIGKLSDDALTIELAKRLGSVGDKYVGYSAAKEHDALAGVNPIPNPLQEE